MKFSYNLPVDKMADPNEFLTAAAIGEIARAAEAAGFSACCVTDHPAPTQSWVDGGGHHALDPFVGLAFAAAVTSRLRLHTNVIVGAYRNPFLMAKSAATLDRLSGGRLIFGIGSGYLKPEFDALGVPFEGRGDAIDEAIRLMKRIWTGETIDFEGKGFRAAGIASLPTPVQHPNPPLWSGGNSDRAIHRAVELCDGWSPFPVSGQGSVFTRTESLATLDDLARKIDFAKEYAVSVGRVQPLQICMVPFSLGRMPTTRPGRDVLIDEVSTLSALGVGWMTISLPCHDRKECIDNARWFGEEVIRAVSVKDLI